MTVRPCPACEGVAADRRGFTRGFEILRCRRCSTLFTPDTESVNPPQDYENYYDHGNLALPGFVGASVDRLVRGFDRYRRDNRFLDVGFGSGAAIEAALRANWDAEGVEVSESAVDHARDKGLRAVHAELRQAGYPEGHFDVVFLSEVLEHVPAPRQLLEDARRVLRPGGLLWASTPHGRGISSRLMGLQWSVMDPPEHLQLFSLSGVRRMFGSAGLTIDRLTSTGVNPVELLRHCRTAIVKPSAPDGFNRVQSGYQILETVYRRPILTRAKQVVDGTLSASRMGDSLRIWATKA